MEKLTAKNNLRGELENILQFCTVDCPIIVTRNALITALQRFLEGDVILNDLKDWASMIEAYDGVQYEPGFEKLIANIIFFIASPEINGVLDLEVCNSFINELSSSV